MLTFSFMETFFFLSLGITFVLILLLIYHHTQRMTKTEEKVDMLFDIVQNMVKEVTEHRSEITGLLNRPSIISGNYPFGASSRTMNVIYENDEDDININVQDLGENSRIEHLDENEEEDDEDEDEDDEDDDDDEDEDEDDQDDDSDIVLTELEPIDHYAESNSHNFQTTQDEYIKIKIEDDESSSKIDEIPTEELMNDENLSDPMENNVVDAVIETESQKIDQKNDIEYYKKMGLHALKQEVLSKGLAKDVSKMKKHELLQFFTSQ